MDILGILLNPKFNPDIKEKFVIINTKTFLSPIPKMDLKTSIGFDPDAQIPEKRTQQLIDYINVKLAALGQPTFEKVEKETSPIMDMAQSILFNYREKNRLLTDYLCPADQRIQNFLNQYLEELAPEERAVKLPSDTFVLNHHGVARTLSLPPDQDRFESDIITSCRVKNGILNNPKNDRRTTKGVFHITEGGLAIPDDKKAVPKRTFARLLKHALNPPKQLLQLPFTASQKRKAELFVSLLLRPTVCPEVPNFIERKSLEIRFFTPGNLVSNLDFVESIFGNAGDPYLPENNAELDVDHWTGHTGCVILAPHLLKVTKKSLGLPEVTNATERQKRDGMCWKDENEYYNEGTPFKITARDHRGVIVTLIADNYYGYCKKEVKTQISYSANLFGFCEEEHSGGALVYPSYDLGEELKDSQPLEPEEGYKTFEEMVASYGQTMLIHPTGYATDKHFSDIIYLPENAQIQLDNQQISWMRNNEPQSLRLIPNYTYIFPSGFKVAMVKPAQGRRWRLVGTRAEGTLCHKPCTVSGGGKSEISKPISDAIVNGPLYINDLQKDFAFIKEIVNKKYDMRFRDPNRYHKNNRSFFSSDRSLGSVIKLLTPSKTDYTDEYNAWLESIPKHVKDLALLIKRYYKPDWGENWINRFSVDLIDGTAGKELRYRKKKIITDYLRVGFTKDNSRRTFGLRKDFFPAVKISEADDITASTVVPTKFFQGINKRISGDQAVKVIENCEYRFFQRPDDAIIRGYDKRTETDLSRPDNFLSNYEPLTREFCNELVKDTIRFEQYTEPMQQLIRSFLDASSPDYIVSSAHPRIVGNKPTKNPRYLQIRPDVESPRDRYVAEISTRLRRRIPSSEPCLNPVDAILPGRRNNPPDTQNSIRSLCVFNPIHYMELPELFMEFIASLTGKSPSTTGAGSEGALTKGPFNALLPIHDLNNALTAYLLTDYKCFITASGHIGPHYRVDHDISLLVPEIWCRMRVAERNPDYLISKGFLEKCEDFEHEGKPVYASRLGYRITAQFAREFGGRIFNNPIAVFPPEMLRPEDQDQDIFIDGIDNIVTAHKWVAERYFRDDSIEAACPPLKILLHIMAYGQYEGRDLNHPEIRAQFTQAVTLESDWYMKRLVEQQRVARELCQRHIESLEAFLTKSVYSEEAKRLKITERLNYAKKRQKELASRNYLEKIKGTLGVDPAVRNPG